MTWTAYNLGKEVRLLGRWSGKRLKFLPKLPNRQTSLQGDLQTPIRVIIRAVPNHTQNSRGKGSGVQNHGFLATQ